MKTPPGSSGKFMPPVVPPPETSPLRMGAEVALGVLKLAGIAFDLIDDPAAWIRRNGLRPSGAPLPSPLSPRPIERIR